jgi:hypothetical protein
MEIFAVGMTAPEASVMVPRILPRLPCPNSREAAHRETAAENITRRNIFDPPEN